MTVAAAVHAIVGQESLLADEALEGILQAAIGADRESGLQVLRGEETTWSRLVNTVGMGSLFAERRAVVVRNADALKGDGDEIAAYLEDPTPGVTLVLLASKPDKRLKAWKRVLDKAKVTPADAPKGRGVRAFAEDRLRRRKLRLTEEGVSELVERVGQDLRRMVGEIDKLEAFASSSDKAQLSAEDVAAVLGRGLAQPLYKLGDAFAARRAGQSLELALSLLEDGEAALRLLATLHRSLRQVRGAKSLQGRRASRDEMIKRLGLIPFKASAVLEAAAQWSEEDLRRAVGALGTADRRMKTGVTAEVALAAAITEACGRRRAGSRELTRPMPWPRRGR